MQIPRVVLSEAPIGQSSTPVGPGTPGVVVVEAGNKQMPSSGSTMAPIGHVAGAASEPCPIQTLATVFRIKPIGHVATPSTTVGVDCTRQMFATASRISLSPQVGAPEVLRLTQILRTGSKTPIVQVATPSTI